MLLRGSNKEAKNIQNLREIAGAKGHVENTINI